MKPILANRLNSILHTHITRMRSSLSGVLIVAFKSLVPYTGCPRRNGQNFGRVFLMLNYTDITQKTYIKVERLRR